MIPGSRIHCSPAYGRDYETEEEVLADWNANKDFFMENRSHSYINKSNAERFGVPTGEINIRYNEKTEVCTITGLPVNPDL